MQTPRISLIKKDKEYLNFTTKKGRYLVGFQDKHLAHYIKDSLPENIANINIYRSKCVPVPVGKNICEFDGIKLILPRRERYLDIDITSGYVTDSCNDLCESGRYMVESIDIHSFIEKPFQYIFPYEILQSYKGQTILKCKLIEKYNTYKKNGF